MSGNDFNMTGIGEGELPTNSDNEGKEEPVENVEANVPQNKDFGLVKQCKGKA